jgi:hypothetical protein
MAPIVLVVVAVDAEAGAVILDHGWNGLRIANSGAVIGKVVLPHNVWRTVVPRIRVGENARSAISGWPKKNQCHQAYANRAVHRSSASMMGTPSRTVRWVTANGWSIAVRNVV